MPQQSEHNDLIYCYAVHHVCMDEHRGLFMYSTVKRECKIRQEYERGSNSHTLLSFFNQLLHSYCVVFNNGKYLHANLLV